MIKATLLLGDGLFNNLKNITKQVWKNGRDQEFFGRCFRMMGVSWRSMVKKDMGSSMSIS